MLILTRSRYLDCILEIIVCQRSIARGERLVCFGPAHTVYEAPRSVYADQTQQQTALVDPPRRVKQVNQVLPQQKAPVQHHSGLGQVNASAQAFTSELLVRRRASPASHLAVDG